MALPLGGRDSAWPPSAHSAAYGLYAEHSAWYSGDPDQLAQIYGGTVADSGARSDSVAGWVKSRIDRWWGRDRSKEPRRTRLHIPLASDIATKSSDLLFSEPPEIVAPGGSPAVQERILQILEGGAIFNTLLEAGEVASALGGVFLRATWDRDIQPEHPFLSVIHADGAVPTFRHGRMVEVTLWKEIGSDKDGNVIRLLEGHTPGFIEYGVYVGRSQTLGQRVPLSDFQETAVLAEGMNVDGLVPTGIDRLAVVYVPNMRPNRLDRRSALGRSDFQGVEGAFDALDEAWNSWMRDLQLGRARIIVPSEYLRSEGKGRGATFDREQEIFQPIDGMHPSQMGNGISLQQGEIRWEAHFNTVRQLTLEAIGKAGYSPQSFGLGSDGVAQTATEVEARERQSFVTRNKKVRYWAPAIAEIVEVLLMLDKAQGFLGAVDPVRPEVVFGDSVQDNVDRTSLTVKALSDAHAISTETKVRMVHPEWDEERVAAEVVAIMREDGVLVTDPGALPA